MGLLAVCSCKIGKKVKYFLTSKGKKQDTVSIQNQSKTEVWQREAQCPTSGTHDLLGSRGLSSSSSLALPSTAHIACLTGSGGLQSTAAAVVSGPPVVLKRVGVSSGAGLHLHQKPLLGSLQGLDSPQLLFIIPSILELLLHLWLHLSL